MKHTLRQHLSNAFSEEELCQWFDPLKIDHDENGKQLDVVFPHPLFGEWFQNSIKSIFEDRLGDFLAPGYVVSYRNMPEAGGNGSAPGKAASRIDHPFGGRWTFENYHCSKRNLFSLASAKEAARNLATYNPLILTGGNGTGKTHLIKAIANEASKTLDKDAIFCGGVEDLHLLYFTRFGGEKASARRHMAERSILLLDNLQFIKNYPDMQEELIMLFDLFYDRGRQMVFSCLEKVGGCEFLDPQLRTRLEWGLTVALMEPDLEARAKYVDDYNRSKSLGLGKEQMLTLSQRFANFRSLQGILLKLYAFKQLMRRPISNEDFDNILQHTEHRSAANVTPEDIVNAVADHFGLTRQDLVGTSRRKPIVQARQTAMFLCREMTQCSFPALGALFGGKDHSTAMYAVKKIKEQQSVDPTMKKMLTTMKKKCQEWAKQ